MITLNITVNLDEQSVHRAVQAHLNASVYWDTAAEGELNLPNVNDLADQIMRDPRFLSELTRVIERKLQQSVCDSQLKNLVNAMLLPQVDTMANAVFDHVGEKLVQSRKAKKLLGQGCGK